MDDALALTRLEMRDPRFAPRRLDVEQRDDGTLLLHNPTPLAMDFDTGLGPLSHWAKAEPERTWLAERPAQWLVRSAQSAAHGLELPLAIR